MKHPKYGARTKTSSSTSRIEIERTIARYGASGFGYAWKEDGVIIYFIFSDRKISMRMKLPDKKDKKFLLRKHYNSVKQNTPAEAYAAWEKSCRSHWRALALLVKAKFAAIEAGITTFEEEFLSSIVVEAPSGKSQTAGEWIIPQLKAASTIKMFPQPE